MDTKVKMQQISCSKSMRAELAHKAQSIPPLVPARGGGTEAFPRTEFTRGHGGSVS